ncbi:hypothetical protein SAMN03159343_0193 [Klenkia marina]|uniref:Uncharacterized protein n=1 Tax=Klenkia marina TaxID=1960309 RepID=A0A1G4X988_9ACTN|nr:hypothetical protein [Klenkia marina]SCX37761.1 hypothetical protein SAMN03159343_0193 [Klenkia marina]
MAVPRAPAGLEPEAVAGVLDDVVEVDEVEVDEVVEVVVAGDVVAELVAGVPDVVAAGVVVAGEESPDEELLAEELLGEELLAEELLGEEDPWAAAAPAPPRSIPAVTTAATVVRTARARTEPTFRQPREEGGSRAGWPVGDGP